MKNPDFLFIKLLSTIFEANILCTVIKKVTKVKKYIFRVFFLQYSSRRRGQYGKTKRARRGCACAREDESAKRGCD